MLLDSGLEMLVQEHWQEVGVEKERMPLAVDWTRYRKLEDQGILLVLGARRNERLIGYNAFFYLPHLHYSTTQLAGCDAIYVTRKHRMSGAGIALIDRAERDLAERAKPDWCRITYHDRHGIELLGKVLRKRGYVASDTTYGKMVRA